MVIVRFVSGLLNADQYDELKKARIEYALEVIVSETVKYVLLGVLFYNNLSEYLIASVGLALLKINTGGSHRKTQAGCFIQSAVVFKCIFLLSRIRETEVFFMPVSVILAVAILAFAPVFSKNRRCYSTRQKSKMKTRSLCVLLLMTAAGYVIKDLKSLFTAVELTVTIDIILCRSTSFLCRSMSVCSQRVEN